MFIEDEHAGIGIFDYFMEITVKPGEEVNDPIRFIPFSLLKELLVFLALPDITHHLIEVLVGAGNIRSIE